jgi:predicted ATPase
MSDIKRIVLIGGPASGKTSVIDQLQAANNQVFPEISRKVIQEARKNGIEQLFLADPLAFSNRLLAGRIAQFKDARPGVNFYDRGIPDVPAYHKFTGDPIPEEYMNACHNFKYDKVFFFPPWENIHQQDDERYEDFEQATLLGDLLLETYKLLDYKVTFVPFDTLENRKNFIINHTSD